MDKAAQGCKASILSLGTAVPPRRYTTKELIDLAHEAFGLEEPLKSWYEKVSSHSSIEGRRSVLDSDNLIALAKASHGERNALFKTYAPKLAAESARKAIEQWGGDPSEITHLISISCTGVMAPGIEAHLIKELDMRADIERLGINMMGCFGAFRGLMAAKALAEQSAAHRVLVVCTELCSLHLIGATEREQLLGNALFADGSAACLVGCTDGLFEIVTQKCRLIDDSLNEMTWETGDLSFVMRLTEQVPPLIRKEIISFTHELLGDRSIDECDFAIHPGGKAILHGIEKACHLTKEQTFASWEILAEYGNMSSPTFLFVLERLHKSRSERKPTVGFGFGPGLALEGILLQ